MIELSTGEWLDQTIEGITEFTTGYIKTHLLEVFEGLRKEYEDVKKNAPKVREKESVRSGPSGRDVLWSGDSRDRGRSSADQPPERGHLRPLHEDR